ncbi:MAG: CBS domain-containing protein [Gammaproteobacteria bacterium]|nr:MAG: CBS domain-containing protein [Gammaproteobacteria bacterium]
MKITDMITPTGIARPEMPVREALRLCVAADVPGIPFGDEQGIRGRISVRHILTHTCIPEYMVRYAHVIGERLDHLALPEEKAKVVLRLPIDPFVLEAYPAITSHSPLVKALALMEEFDTHYLFVIDEGRYLGVVTHLAIARRMLELDG